MATISRLLKMIGLFCKRALQKRLYSADETIILRSLLIVATPYVQIERERGVQVQGGGGCVQR